MAATSRLAALLLLLAPKLVRSAAPVSKECSAAGTCAAEAAAEALEMETQEINVELLQSRKHSMANAANASANSTVMALAAAGHKNFKAAFKAQNQEVDQEKLQPYKNFKVALAFKEKFEAKKSQGGGAGGDPGSQNPWLPAAFGGSHHQGAEATTAAVPEPLEVDELQYCKDTCTDHGFCCTRDSGCDQPSCVIGCEVAKTATSYDECALTCAEFRGTCFATPSGFSTASTCTAGTCECEGSFGPGNCEPGADIACEAGCSYYRPLAEAACQDDDAIAVSIAAVFQAVIGGCADVVGLCYNENIGCLVQTICPVTCGSCPAQKKLNPYKIFTAVAKD